MDIYPNITVFIQIANFLVLLFALNIIFYRPIRRILGRRSEEVRDLHESIVDFREKSDQCGKELDESYIFGWLIAVAFNVFTIVFCRFSMVYKQVLLQKAGCRLC